MSSTEISALEGDAEGKAEAMCIKPVSDTSHGDSDELSSASESSVGQLEPKGVSFQTRQTNGGSLVIKLPLRFIFVALIASMVLAFSAGRLARILLHERLHSLAASKLAKSEPMENLPQLYSKSSLPETAYTDHHFQVGRSVMAGTRLAKRVPALSSCVVEDNGENVCEASPLSQLPMQGATPQGAHLLVDIEHVDPIFLNSSERLAHAMIKLIERGNMTLLSYHCHRLDPVGVSCVGLSHNSHVSFHTWPVEGVITLDLFSSRVKSSTVHLIPLFKSYFGVQRRNPFVKEENVPPPHLVWALKQRGFDKNDFGTVRLRSESSAEWLLGNIELEKRFVASVESQVQRIEIWDVLNPRFIDYKDHLASLEGNQTYESQHPELFDYDRVLLLDGVLQGRRRGEAAYHETLVHPAMFAHDEPKRVAILGGGEGAVLREVLKHDTVEKAVMIEIDKELVEVSREYLSEWNDCSHLVGSTASCFDDPRAEIHYTDATEWFVDRFGVDDKVDENERFDVIIVGVLDSSTKDMVSGTRVESGDFAVALYNSLSDTGLVVVQTGQQGRYHDPPRSFDKNRQLSTLLNNLETAGFQNILDFEEPHSGFGRSSGYIIAMKDFASRADWFTNEADINQEIHNRALRTSSDESPFHHFDGAHMMSNVFANRINEERWCRGDNVCDKHGFDPEIDYVSIKHIEVGTSHVSGRAGRGLFTKVPIKNGTMIALDESVRSIYVPTLTYDLLWTFLGCTEHAFWKAFCYGYVEGYGWVRNTLGDTDAGVESGITLFANHGCHGTNNIGVRDWTEDDEVGDSSIMSAYRLVYNPFSNRHFPQWYEEPFVAIRDIESGEELLDNYVFYGGDFGDFEYENNVKELREMCGSGEGLITGYEGKHKQ